MGLKKILYRVKDKAYEASVKRHDLFMERSKERFERALSSDEVRRLSEMVGCWDGCSESVYEGRVNGFKISLIKRDMGFVFRDICYSIYVFNEENMKIGVNFGSSYDEKERKKNKSLFLMARQKYVERSRMGESERDSSADLKRLEDVGRARKLLELS